MTPGAQPQNPLFAEIERQNDSFKFVDREPTALETDSVAAPAGETFAPSAADRDLRVSNPQSGMRNNKTVNKSAWIRQQPATMPAKAVVEKARSEGITLSAAHVYTARNTASKAPDRKPVQTQNRTAASATTAQPGPSQQRAAEAEFADFRRLVVKVGVLRAEQMLAEVKREFGL